ncbi:DUF1499 domain-containing protein [Sneathiella marina]|uniref:DUF1499 domain-containing protein n=1 Tax=Sneathiella marina TaxID=2950108 RepID=A0ABY4W7Y8_9PROT|nr:DUF1499 domain-containing protein [Sneathiella marina]USG61870.1 DUF1499 domain-containing protein [Sneathiella marina]
MLKNILKNVQRPDIDFAGLKKPRKPNSYLMCPRDYCLYPGKDVSPEFNIPAQQLAHLFEKMALAQDRTEKISETDKQGDVQMDFVQYSALIGYPDTITVRFIELTDETSTLAIFSRAHYGYRDFNVNENRIKNWMEKLRSSL